MTCKDAIDKIVEYLDSELTPDIVSEFEAHLVVCAPCRAYLATYRKTGELLGKINRVELPATLQAKLRQLLAGPRRAPGRS